MVKEQLERRGIHDPRVLAAFLAVPRELFVRTSSLEQAYGDHPLPIGDGQTISQPYVVAITLQALALQGHERVLEIGTGSGYSAALLTHLAAEVFTVERIESHARQAGDRLARLGYRAHVRHGDGTLGWPEHAPYDAICVAAGGPHVPPSLIDQLVEGGRLVIPVRADGHQELLRAVRRRHGFEAESLGEVMFVPLIGEHGEPEALRSRASS